MSSPLDGRIRTIAREEAAAVVHSAGVPVAGAPDTQDLQQQITDLHEHLHMAATAIKRLETRIDVLEKAAGETGQEEPPSVRRTRRKTAGE